MTTMGSEIWGRLGRVLPGGDNLSAGLAAPDKTSRLFAGIDAEKRRHLLILLNHGDAVLKDTHSRGLKVHTRELKILEKDSAGYIDIECSDPTGHDAFDLIGGEIATGLESTTAAPATVVTQVLGKWRRFWGQVPVHAMSREEQIGLFAEIWFLSNWLIPAIGARTAVDRWRGPFGARNDFEWEGCSVEVKATTSTRGLIHRINGLEQLDVATDGKLLLFSMQLREEGGAVLTLADLVAKCRQLLITDPDTLSVFEAGLVRVGYSLVHETEYAKIHLRILKETLFKVEADFPRLTKTMFISGVPVGIERVEYEVNLSAFSHLILANTAGEKPGIFK